MVASAVSLPSLPSQGTLGRMMKLDTRQVGLGLLLSDRQGISSCLSSTPLGWRKYCNALAFWWPWGLELAWAQ